MRIGCSPQRRAGLFSTWSSGSTRKRRARASSTWLPASGTSAAGCRNPSMHYGSPRAKTSRPDKGGQMGRVVVGCAKGNENPDAVVAAYLTAGAALDRGDEVVMWLTSDGVRLAT